MLNNENNISEKINILVVDDEDVMRSLLFDALTDVGYNVEVASSAEEALEKFRHIPFEIVITDLKMPGMSGIEVMSKLKETNSNICIIVITGYPSIERAIEVMRQGAYDYITKPFNLEELRVIVKRAAEKQLLLREKEVYREMAITDALTNVYNRRYFQEVLLREINRAERYGHFLSSLMIDIDDFKLYNDIHGHLSGDEILRQIASLFMQCTRKVDFIFRYGGEEFVFLLPETGKEGAFVLAKRIRGVVEGAGFKYGERQLTVSIGLAVYPDDVQKGNELISKADEALYQAKRLGKNRVCLLEIKDDKKSNAG